MKNLFKYYFLKILINPFAYILNAAFVIFSGINYFFSSNFFSGGTTDLNLFFLSMASLGIIYFPSIVSVISSSYQESSFPFSSIKIITAKLLTLLSVFVFTLIVTAIIPFGVHLFGNIDFAQFFTGYIGMIFFAFSSISFVLFVFTLLKKTARSLVCSAVILIATNLVHLLPLYTNLKINLSPLLFFSTVAHFDAGGKGILDTRDLIFFFATGILFVFLSWTVSEFSRGNKSHSLKTKTFLSLITVFLVFLDSRFFFIRKDISSSQKYSVSQYTKNLISKIEQPLAVTFYRSALLVNRFPQVKDVEYYLKETASLNKNVSFQIIEPSSKEIIEKLQLYGIQSQALELSKTQERNIAEVYSAVTFTYLGETEVIPFVTDVSNLEFDLISRVQYLVNKKERYAQIVVGNGLTLDGDYFYVKAWLESQGFKILQTRLPSEENELPVFTDFPSIPTVILGSSNFKKQDCNAVENFLLNGGKAFIASQNFNVDFSDQWKITKRQPFFEQIFYTFGIVYEENPLCDISNFQMVLTSTTNAQGASTAPVTDYVNYPLWPVLPEQENAPYGMTLFWPSSIKLEEEAASSENFILKPYLLTSPGSWNLQPFNGEYITNPYYINQAKEPEQEYKTSIVAASLQKKTSQSIDAIIFTDEYTFTSAMIAYSSGKILDVRSLEFLGDSLLKLNGESEVVNLKRKSSFTSTLYKVTDSDFEYCKKNVYLMIFIIPLMINLTICLAAKFIRRRFNDEKSED